jgi:hypothetical protein
MKKANTADQWMIKWTINLSNKGINILILLKNYEIIYINQLYKIQLTLKNVDKQYKHKIIPAS